MNLETNHINFIQEIKSQIKNAYYIIVLTV